ncbi:MAG: cysteine hydrolase [Glaciimonas sp.]|nr:cysteine hydrolase [Glaciimonas sp.]
MNTATIRSIVGATASTQINPKTTALIAIDIQNEYFNGQLPIPDGLTVLRNTNRLISMADQHGMPVFHIQHITPVGSPIFAENSATAAIHPEVQRSAQHSVIAKGAPSAFAGTALHQQLQARGITTLIISGLMTHNCIAATVFDGAGLGYQNIVADDACATRDLPTADGSVINHKVLHQAVIAGLSDVAAEIRSTNDILELSLES